MDVRCVVAAGDQLGEGPVWSPREGRLYWFDIKGRRLAWYEPEMDARGAFDLPLRASAAAPRAQGGLLMATEKGLMIVDPDAGTLEMKQAFAMPPGLSIFSVSKRALAKAATITGRGYYFDFLEFQINHEGGMTPSTPVIPLIYALKSKLEDITTEGLENRYARHARLNKKVRDWGFAKGFKLFPEVGYGSVTLNCFANTLNVDLIALNTILKTKHGLVIDGGYGKLKGKTFRISNMGDETDETIAALLKALDASLAETPKATG